MFFQYLVTMYKNKYIFLQINELIFLYKYEYCAYFLFFPAFFYKILLAFTLLPFSQSHFLSC